MIKRLTLTSVLVFFVLSIFAVQPVSQKTALKYITEHKNELNLSDQDITDLVMVQDHYDDYSDMNRVWFQQTVNGVALKNGYVAVHIKDGKVVHVANSGVYDLKKQIKTTQPAIDARMAILKSASFVKTGNVANAIPRGKLDKTSQTYTFDAVDGLTNQEMYAKLYLAKDRNEKVHLAWEIQFESIDRKNIWNIEVDATDGSLVNKNDMILHCEFGTGKYLASQGGHEASEAHSHKRIEEVLPSNGGNGTDEDILAGAYRVYPFTLESPLNGSRQLISNPDDAVASPFGWHDTNGASGAEYTVTRGNNVYAYADKNADNNPDAGSSPDGGAGLNFDFPLSFASQLDTLDNSKAVVTQLFYMNNIMHDIFAKYGFTETNYNFQFRNYLGNTATDNDFVYAEAHDGAGNNNANFATSPDGTNSAFSRTRMQMFMWDGTGPSTVTFNAPGSIAGDYEHGTASGWGPCAYNVTAAVANATSSTTPASYVCGPVNNASAIAGKIALIDRGTCNFTEKVLYVQQAGAVGAIIINRESAGDSLIGMAAGTNAGAVTIPAVFVTYATGQKLRDNLATANVTLLRSSDNNCLEFDGSLDNGIVSHEYGHGISTRLTGAGGNTCLSNEEQAGEGWSDFFALVLTKLPGDTKNTARGIGNYAIGASTTGPGIRRNPYSYDMTINPITYADMAGDPEVHQIGEIWCSAIWDMYWILIEKYGYSNDLYNGTAGNNRAIKLVVEGLKLQGCNPGFLTSRNAILKADSILYGYADKCEIWTAFARRGMGASAVQGTSSNATDQTAAFNLPAACNTSPTATASFTVSDTTVCIGGSLTFTNTSTASSGSPDSVRWTINGGTPSTSTSTTTVSPVFNTVGNYVISLVAYKSGNPSAAATKSIRVKPNAAITLTSGAGTNNQTKCIGNAITNITYSITGGGTGAGVTGLPAGFTGVYSNGVFTISGAPTGTGTFNYTVTTTGSCTQATATGSIIVNCGCATPPTVTLSSTSGTTCGTTPVTVSNNTFGGSATSVTITENGAGSVGAGSANSSPFSFTYTPAAGDIGNTVTVTVTTDNPNALCVAATATYLLQVRSNAVITLTSAAGTNNQTKCAGTSITNITYSVTGGGTGAGVTGLPTGVTGSFSGGVFTISGTPTQTGTFNYTVTTTGTCTQTTATGTIVVNPNATISLSSAAGTNNQTKCVGTAITNITYSVGGSGTGAGVTGLPTGVTGNFSGGVFTISGTPTQTGTFNYTVTTTGTCTQATATGTITVNANAAVALTSAVGTNGQTLCVSTPVTAITYSVSGGGTGAGVTGLPTGVTGNFSGGVFTISGTPTQTGTFNYTVTTTGTCTQATASGSITVNSCGCASAPTVTLGSGSGSTCSNTAITINGNTFGGSATGVTITENGAGSVGAGSANSSPFSITYTPAAGDGGNTVTITVTTNNPNGAPCVAASATYQLTVNAAPGTPGITQSGDTLYSSVIVAGASYEWYKGGVLAMATSTPYYKLASAGSYTLKIVSGSCTSVESAAFAAVYTGIRNNKKEVEFSVIPNPSNGDFEVRMYSAVAKKYSLALYNLTGQEIIKEEMNVRAGNNVKKLNVNGLEKGVYILSIMGDNGIATQNIIIQ